MWGTGAAGSADAPVHTCVQTHTDTRTQMHTDTHMHTRVGARQPCRRPGSPFPPPTWHVPAPEAPAQPGAAPAEPAPRPGLTALMFLRETPKLTIAEGRHCKETRAP